MEKIGPPLWFLAEITYRCPLHCVFCYNPVDFAVNDQELSTEEWLKVLREARAAGSVQCGFSGGEPLLRDDLEILVAEAHKLGFYTNLLTSGVGLTEERAARLKEAGLDHIQLSFQDTTRELNDFLSHTKTFELKQKVAKIIKDNGWPMVLNCVLHRLNIDHIDKLIAAPWLPAGPGPGCRRSVGSGATSGPTCRPGGSSIPWVPAAGSG